MDLAFMKTRSVIRCRLCTHIKLLRLCSGPTNEDVKLNDISRYEPSLSAKFTQEDIQSIVNFGRGNHLGNLKVPAVALPPVIVDAVNDLLYAQKGLFKVIKRDAATLDAYLKSRTAPYLNPSQTKFNKNQWKAKMMARLEALDADLTPGQQQMYAEEIETEGERRRIELKQMSGFWKSISYDSHNACLAYTLCRAAPNYAVAIRILSEIARRDPSFSPEAVLDFGSGCGSLVWSLLAMWPQETKFFYLNDVSNEFNNVASSILSGDDVDFNPIANGIYFKQHLPADVRPNFDLVFCGYTLSELNGPGSRLAAIKHMLKCTKSYIVFVENGTLRSHHLMEEVREYVASNFADQFEIFAPCPHLKPCPLLLTNLKQQRKSLICRTSVTYLPFPVRNHTKPNASSEQFTYLVFRRKPSDDLVSQKGDDAEMRWPRVVQPPRIGTGHVTLRLCSSDGTASQSIVSKGKYPSFFYLMCKKINLGDRLPLPSLEAFEIESESVSSVDEEVEGNNDGGAE